MLTITQIRRNPIATRGSGEVLSLTTGGYDKENNPLPNEKFAALVDEMQGRAQAAGETVTEHHSFTGGAKAGVHRTLGRFTSYYSGELSVGVDGGWHFTGTMQFYDEFDWVQL